MRAVRHLGRLQASVEQRLDKLEVLVLPLGAPITVDKDGIAAFATIELDNVWSGFVRSFYFSWFLEARTVAGNRIHATSGLPESFRDLTKHASKLLYGRTPEWKSGRIDPAWHEKRVLTTLATACAPGHLSQIQMGMSAASTVFDYLHTMRNFYAHRGQETGHKLPNVARKLGLAHTRRASEIVLGIPPKASTTILLTWIAEIRGVTQIICA